MQTNHHAVRALRESRGWRATRFADAVNISRQYLCNIEAGRRAANPEVLARMALVLGVPIDTLISHRTPEEVS